MARYLATSFYRNLCTRYKKGLTKMPVPGAYRSPLEVLKNDLFGKESSDLPATPRETDILIIGGGIIGSSVAYWLKQRNPEGFSCIVVDKDLTYGNSSSAQSYAYLCTQFTTPEYVELAMYCRKFLEDIDEHLSFYDQKPPNIEFIPMRFLTLATPSGAEDLNESFKFQRQAGAFVDMLSSEKLKSMFPWLNVDGIEAGVLGQSCEGLFNAAALLAGFKNKAMSLGVRYITGDIVGFDMSNKATKFQQDGSVIEEPFIDFVDMQIEDCIYPIKAPIIINATGSNAPEIARFAKIGNSKRTDLSVPLPLEARKLSMFIIHCPDGPTLDMPVLVDPVSGLHISRNGFGGDYICHGHPLDAEPIGVDTTDEPSMALYNEKLYPALVSRIPAFKNCQLKGGWCSKMDHNFEDNHLIIGNHHHHRNILFAGGMGYHSALFAPGIGRAIMEYTFDEGFNSIDLIDFGFERFLGKQYLPNVRVT